MFAVSGILLLCLLEKTFVDLKSFDEPIVPGRLFSTQFSSSDRYLRCSHEKKKTIESSLLVSDD